MILFGYFYYFAKLDYLFMQVQLQADGSKEVWDTKGCHEWTGYGCCHDDHVSVICSWLLVWYWNSGRRLPTRFTSRFRPWQDADCEYALLFLFQQVHCRLLVSEIDYSSTNLQCQHVYILLDIFSTIFSLVCVKLQVNTFRHCCCTSVRVFSYLMYPPIGLNKLWLTVVGFILYSLRIFSSTRFCLLSSAKYITLQWYVSRAHNSYVWSRVLDSVITVTGYYWNS